MNKAETLNLKLLLDSINKENIIEIYNDITSTKYIKYKTIYYVIREDDEEIFYRRPSEKTIWERCSHCWSNIQYWKQCEYCLEKYWKEDMHDDYRLNDCYRILIPNDKIMDEFSDHEHMFGRLSYKWVWIEFLLYLHNLCIKIKWLDKYIYNITE